jgi:hypothetical protein
MQMNQEMNDRLVIRISESLKKSIEKLAKKQNLTSSELVRNVLEEAVSKNQREIQDCIVMVDTISRYIQEQLIGKAFMGYYSDFDAINKEIRDYKKILYTHQAKAIELITEEIHLSDNRIERLKNAFQKDIKALNDYSSRYTEDERANDYFGDYKDNIIRLEDELWDSTDKLYNLMISAYCEGQA